MLFSKWIFRRRRVSVGTDHSALHPNKVSKGLDMKADSEKIVSIGGWGTASMMRYSCHCYNNLPIAAFQSAPTPIAKPNSESAFMSSPFDSLPIDHGRTASYPTAPVQIPASGTTARGSSKLLASHCGRQRNSGLRSSDICAVVGV
jgi:hypothetical protein